MSLATPQTPAGPVPAPLGTRALARLIDTVLGGLLGWVLVWVVPQIGDQSTARLTAAGVGVLIVVVVLALLGLTGYLPGGLLLRVRQVRMDTGSRPGWRGAAKYLLIGLVTAATLGIGYLVAVILLARDPLRRGFHDKVSGLIVINAKVSAPNRPAAGQTGADPAGTGTGWGAEPPPAGVPALHEWPGHPIGDSGTNWPSAPPAPSPSPASSGAWPARPSEVSPQPAPAPPEVEIQLGDGRRFAGRVLALGRGPVPPPTLPDATPVRVDDTSMSVSKTHLLIGIDETGLWAMDLNSTNGSAVRTASGLDRLRPGVRTQVPPGTTVDFGQCSVLIAP